MYVHDYGAPVGWRLAIADPAGVCAIVIQNAMGMTQVSTRRSGLAVLHGVTVMT